MEEIINPQTANASEWLGLFLITLAIGGSVFFFTRLLIRLYFQGQGRVETDSLGAPEFGVAAGLVALFGMLTSAGAAARSSGKPAATITVGTLVQGGIFQGFLCVGLLTFLLVRKHDLVRLYGLNRMSFSSQTGWAALLLMAFYPLLDLIMRISTRAHGGDHEPQAIVEFARGLTLPAEQLMMIVFAVIIAPLTEEFLFRGYLYPTLKKHFGGLLSLLLTSALFGFIHMHGPSFLPLAVFGGVLAVAYERTGSLLVPMMMHAVFNALNMVAMKLLPDLIQ